MAPSRLLIYRKRKIQGLALPETPNQCYETSLLPIVGDSSIELEIVKGSRMSSRLLSIPRIGVFLPLIGVLVCSCADKTTAIRAEQQSQPASMPAHSATVPDRFLGIWAMGETPCTLPINTDADGVLVVSEKKIQGYEYHVVPKKIVVVSENPLQITVEGTEVYLGSQTIDVTQTMTVEEGRLELTDGQTTEIYVRCK
jgi:hypothetical protein